VKIEYINIINIDEKPEIVLIQIRDDLRKKEITDCEYCKKLLNLQEKGGKKYNSGSNLSAKEITENDEK